MFKRHQPQVAVSPEIKELFDIFMVDTSKPAELLDRGRFCPKEIGRFTLNFVELPVGDNAFVLGRFYSSSPNEIFVYCGNPFSPLYTGVYPIGGTSFEKVITHELGHAIHFHNHPRDFVDGGKEKCEDIADKCAEEFAPQVGEIVHYEFNPDTLSEALRSNIDYWESNSADVTPYNWQTETITIH